MLISLHKYDFSFCSMHIEPILRVSNVSLGTMMKHSLIKSIFLYVYMSVNHGPQQTVELEQEPCVAHIPPPIS